MSLESNCEWYRTRLILKLILSCYPRRSFLRRDVKYFSNLRHDHVADLEQSWGRLSHSTGESPPRTSAWTASFPFADSLGEPFRTPGARSRCGGRGDRRKRSLSDSSRCSFRYSCRSNRCSPSLVLELGVYFHSREGFVSSHYAAPFPRDDSLFGKIVLIKALQAVRHALADILGGVFKSVGKLFQHGKRQ